MEGYYSVALMLKSSLGSDPCRFAPGLPDWLDWVIPPNLSECLLCCHRRESGNEISRLVGV